MHQCLLLEEVTGEPIKQRRLQNIQFMVFYLLVCVNTDFYVSAFLEGVGMVCAAFPWATSIFKTLISLVSF